MSALIIQGAEHNQEEGWRIIFWAKKGEQATTQQTVLYYNYIFFLFFQKKSNIPIKIFKKVFHGFGGLVNLFMYGLGIIIIIN